MRAIIRYSLDGAGAPTYLHIAKYVDAGDVLGVRFIKLGTASYELESDDLAALHRGISLVLLAIQKAPGGGTLDGMWIHVDKGRPG